MLEVKIKKNVGNFNLDISFIHDRGILSIIGSSGCGKSMTLKCIAGLLKPDDGLISIDGRIIYSNENNINIPARHRRTGFVFQNFALFPHMTVYKNIEYGVSDISKTKRNEIISDILERTHIANLGNRYPHQLSGGQQQRCALARTLITNPEILLLDEPFSAADGHTKHILESELIGIIKNNFHKPVLLVTHNIEEAYRLSDRILIIENGKSAQAALKKEVIDHPKTLNAARITGCKNIFETEIISSSKSETLAKCGELTLSVLRVPQKQKQIHLGIRAHYISILSEKSYTNNIFPCVVKDVTEGIFSTTVVVESGGILFRAEIAKTSDILRLCRKNKKLFIHIPPEKIFFTAE